MRLKIRTDAHRINIALPNCLLLNTISAAVCSYAWNKHVFTKPEFGGLHMNFKQLFKEVRRCRRYLEGKPLLYVCSSSGDTVEIWL